MPFLALGGKAKPARLAFDEASEQEPVFVTNVRLFAVDDKLDMVEDRGRDEERVRASERLLPVPEANQANVERIAED